MGTVEALYIFDEHNNPILDHVYAGRPAAPSNILPLYLAHAAPRSSLMYLSSANPPCVLVSMIHDRLLLLCPTSQDTEPLLILEFLRRVTDALEDFLGAPLLASKIEASYDVVFQIVSEMCDGGIVCNTEPNSLREMVEAPTTVGSLLGSLGLPANSPALPTRGQGSSFQSSHLQAMSNSTSASASAIPWRRANVRHTSNELYVDIVENLSVILAPSGKPLSAMASGTIAFTAKISGVPDLQLSLSAPGGKAGIERAMDLPCFHPCVRLARWRDQPGELSFVPPDGRFVLAGYECDLLPDVFASRHVDDKMATPNLKLPASVEVIPCQGTNGDELEVRLTLPLRASGAAESVRSAAGGRFGTSSPALGQSGAGQSGSAHAVDGLVVSVPVPASVRNVMDLRSSRGEANFLAAERIIEWRVSKSDAAQLAGAGATMRCTMVGPSEDEDEGTANATSDRGFHASPYDYEEDAATSSLGNGSGGSARQRESDQKATESGHDGRVQRNKSLMPASCSLSFSVQGSLASGIRVSGLSVNAKTSKGLGAGVTPYKGVKYHTISRQGIEIRC